jgi:small-conductance mechanosensitive channel
MVPPLAVGIQMWPRTAPVAVWIAIVCFAIPAPMFVALTAFVVLFGAANALAHAASRPAPVREGDWVDLGNDQQGRVRAVRWWFTVVDASDGRVALLPNHRVRRLG